MQIRFKFSIRIMLFAITGFSFFLAIFFAQIPTTVECDYTKSLCRETPSGVVDGTRIIVFGIHGSRPSVPIFKTKNIGMPKTQFSELGLVQKYTVRVHATLYRRIQMALYDEYRIFLDVPSKAVPWLG